MKRSTRNNEFREIASNQKDQENKMNRSKTFLNKSVIKKIRNGE